jgi:hypothetical protein
LYQYLYILNLLARYNAIRQRVLRAKDHRCDHTTSPNGIYLMDTNKTNEEIKNLAAGDAATKSTPEAAEMA